MKNTFILIVLLSLFTSCAKKDDKSSGYPISSDIQTGIWKYSYGVGLTPYEERIKIVGNAAVVQQVNMSELVVTETATWYLTGIDADTIQVKDGTDTFNIDFYISGNSLQICLAPGDCTIYYR